MARVTVDADEGQPSSASATTKPAGSTALGRYSRSLDGLRGLAMFFFLAYHAEFAWAKGAFLGLSQFFTLSGFLIMSLLLRTRDRTGGLDLRRFWTQRFRRLLPAALLTLGGVVVFGATIATPSQLHKLPSQVLACLLYVVNWLFIFTHQSYVDLFASPSPVQHFWSLAVEEQFYLLMPVALFFLLRKTRSMKVIAGVFFAAALASTIEMAVIFHVGGNVDRVYYGTDTRAAELLMGVVLAIVLHRRPLRDGPLTRTALPVAGVVTMAISLWAFINVPLTSSVVWQGGMFAFTFVSITLITSVVNGRGPVARFLSWEPLPSFGRIIYGVYLFHWPIFLWLTEDRTGLSQWPLFILRLAVTLVLAIASYHLIEMPIRRGELRRFSLPVRRAIIPVAATLIMIGTLIVSQRTASDPFATLAGAQDRPAPTAGPLKVLVVTDDRGAAVAADMSAAAKKFGHAEVTSVVPFTCTGPASPPTSCRNWLEQWPKLIEQQNPDVVLFNVSTWDPADIASVSGLSASAGAAQDAWVSAALAHGFDRLSAKGATILWRPTPAGTLQQGYIENNQPFARAMNAFVEQRKDLRIFSGDLPTKRSNESAASFDRRMADTLMPGLALYQRAGAGGTRVLVVGDSTGRSMAWGLQRWGTQTGKATVWSTATNGCGIALGGVAKQLGGTVAPSSAACINARAAWTNQIKQFRPQVVVVSSTLTDLADRHFDGWDGYLGPGNATFDKYLLDQYTQAVDTLSAEGATVVWMQNPCMGYGGSKLLVGGAPDRSTFDPKRAIALNQDVLTALVKRRPTKVAVFPLFDALCPNGKFVASQDHVSNIRPDGVHFSVDGALWFARKYGQQVLSTKP